MSGWSAKIKKTGAGCCPGTVRVSLVAPCFCSRVCLQLVCRLLWGPELCLGSKEHVAGWGACQPWQP